MIQKQLALLARPSAPARPSALARHGGLARAAVVVFSWALVQGVVLFGPPGSLALAVVVTFLYTGLFITAHDAMHGTVAPEHPRLNRAIGRLCAMLFAGFDYDHLRARHLLHHRDPTGPGDPDHHRGNASFFAWYGRFMLEYATVGHLVRAALMFWGLSLFVPQSVVFFGWMVPALLSSLQLFTFGIWRVHREPPGGWGDDPLKARTEPFPRLLSFLTSWHFGYHREHHRFPHLPWWRLPEVLGRA